MLIFDENFKPQVLDDINNLVMSEYFWVLDLQLMDFTLVPLLILEEISSKSLELSIGSNKTSIIIPEDWHILIVADETFALDIAEAGKEIPGMDFNAFTYGHNLKNFEPKQIMVTNYFQNFKNITPLLGKHQMLCHPISSTHWVNITPHDVYSKYIKNKLIGDLMW